MLFMNIPFIKTIIHVNMLLKNSRMQYAVTALSQNIFNSICLRDNAKH